MAKKPDLRTLKLDEITVDDEFQQREGGLDTAHLADLAEAHKAKKGCLPRVEVAEVNGLLVLIGGFHRYQVHKNAGDKMIQAAVYKTSLLDATLRAMTQNLEHLGLKRSQADKRRSVHKLVLALRSAKQSWSRRKIADELQVSPWLVGDVLDGLPKESEPAEEPEETVTGRDGRDYHQAPRLGPPKMGPPAAKDTQEAKPARETKEAKKKAPPIGDWRKYPLKEFLDVEPFVWDAIDTFRLVTAGDLHDRLERKEKLSLPMSDIENLKEQITDLREKAESQPVAAPKAVKNFDWKEYDVHLGYVTRGVNDVLDRYPLQTHSQMHTKLEGLIREYANTWTAWRAQLEKD